MQVKHQLRITGNKDVIGALKLDIESIMGEDDTITELQSVEGGNKFQLNLTDAASIMTIISGTVVVTEFVRFIIKRLKEKKQNKIEIKSPIGTVTFLPEKNLSEVVVRDKLKKIIEVL